MLGSVDGCCHQCGDNDLEPTLDVLSDAQNKWMDNYPLASARDGRQPPASPGEQTLTEQIKNVPAPPADIVRAAEFNRLIRDPRLGSR
ncbi:hypothetical protein EVAR_61848_1 [Eumeta japonica]|uniref:Uncharacterized protein n=1 Tax=Eumeta variegata TaxID=151549 RepID=A0A4C1ZZZ5_EUMVA|nr:hypothetical protein EVAR_61848_1 [Eumeta japonica]